MLKKILLYLTKLILFLVVALLTVSNAFSSQTRNDLTAYLSNAGVKIVPFMIAPESNRMQISSVLCSTSHICLGKILDIDLGDAQNNLTEQTRKSLKISKKSRSLHSIYLDNVKKLTNVPIYFNTDASGRDDYLGNNFIKKHNYWIDFGRHQLYLNPKNSLMAQFLKSTAIPYQSIELRNTADHGEHLFAYFSVNGHPPVKFLIDNGASESVIDLDYAKSIGLTIAKQSCAKGSAQVGKIKVCSTHDLMTLTQNNNRISHYMAQGWLTTSLKFVLPNVGRLC